MLDAIPDYCDCQYLTRSLNDFGAASSSSCSASSWTSGVVDFSGGGRIDTSDAGFDVTLLSCTASFTFPAFDSFRCFLTTSGIASASLAIFLFFIEDNMLCDNKNLAKLAHDGLGWGTGEISYQLIEDPLNVISLVDSSYVYKFIIFPSTF